MIFVTPSALLALTIAAASLAALRLGAHPRAPGVFALLATACAALAMARANAPGLGTLAAALASAHLGWAALGPSDRGRAVAIASLGLLAVALEGGPLRPIADWQATAAPLAVMVAISALVSARPHLLTLPEAPRIAAAAVLAALPVAGPIFGLEVPVEVPHDDGGLAVAARASAALVPASALHAQLWSVGRWAAVAAVALVLTERRPLPLAAASVSTLAAIAAGALAWAATNDLGQSSALATSDGPLVIVGPPLSSFSLAPVALRVALTWMALWLAWPAKRATATRSDVVATERSVAGALLWIGLIPAIAAPIMALTLAVGVGSGWIADPATVCALTLAVTSSLRAVSKSPPGSVHLLARDVVQCAAALLLVGGAAGWRVASAWMP